jgi:hypothetical protein
MINPEEKFISSCKAIQPDMLSAAKIQWWGRQRFPEVFNHE